MTLRRITLADLKPGLLFITEHCGKGVVKSFDGTNLVYYWEDYNPTQELTVRDITQETINGLKADFPDKPKRRL